MARVEIKTCWTHVTVAVAIGIFSAPLSAEVPSWDDLANQVFLTSKHNYHIDSESHNNNGLWSFDVRVGTLARVRPFTATTTLEWFNNPFEADDGNLATNGDRLVYQTWPHDFHFDLASTRMLNRLPTRSREDVLGWALQGPIVGESDRTAFGLQSGVIGYPRCVRDDVTNRHQVGPISCTSLEISGIGLIDWSDGGLIVSSNTVPTDIGHLTLLTELDRLWLNEAQVLSLDVERQGIWRSDDTGMSFYSVEDGTIQQPANHVPYEIAPFDTPGSGVVQAAHYHSASGRFVVFGQGLTFSIPDERFLFTLDLSTGDPDFIELPDENGQRFYPLSFASVRQPPTTHKQIVPVVVEAAGRNGTFWTSDLWFFNPGTHTTVTVKSITNPALERSFELASQASKKIVNALEWIGGGSAGDGSTHGALLIESSYQWGTHLTVSGRIWTPDPHSDGTFGHVLPSVPAPFGFSNHSRYLRENVALDGVLSTGISVSHITLDLREPGRFRHNIGVLNTLDEPLTLHLEWGYNEAGTAYVPSQFENPPDANASLTVGPGELVIRSVEGLFPDRFADAWPPRISVTGEKPAIIWLSMVDEVTGDATFVPFTNFDAVSRADMSVGGADTSYRLAIPVVAHNPGRNGSFWKTDLYGFPSASVFGHPLDQPIPFLQPSMPTTDCNGARLEGEILVTLEGEIGTSLELWSSILDSLGYPYLNRTWGWRTIFPDVVHAFPECQDDSSVLAALELVSGSWFSGYSRTYTTREDGGTYGSMLPLYPPGGWPVQHFAGIEIGQPQRINVGFFNGDHDHTITHQVTLYASDGHVQAETYFDLEPLAQRLDAIEDLFGKEFEPGTYGLSVIPLDQDDIQGRSWAYVSIVDSVTNDPINIW